MQVVREPDIQVAKDFLQEEFAALGERRGRLVQVVAECSIAYQGRARSMLHRGERLLLFKPDGTFLVHTAAKAKPVNWQPPGAAFEVAIEDDVLVLTAYRAKPEEMVRVTFDEVRLLLAVPLRDEAELALVGSEDDLQALLFARPELVEEGFVPRRRERDSKRGFYDLDGDDATGRRLIVEIKRTTAGVKEAQQLWRYVERLRGEGTAAGDAATRGILMAPRVADKARALLGDHGLEWKELDWDELLPKVEAMRRSGQASLTKFG
ncbi:MAG: endonuclease NucS [Thermoplasmatota archaeon]